MWYFDGYVCVHECVSTHTHTHTHTHIQGYFKELNLVMYWLFRLDIEKLDFISDNLCLFGGFPWLECRAVQRHISW